MTGWNVKFCPIQICRLDNDFVDFLNLVFSYWLRLLEYAFDAAIEIKDLKKAIEYGARIIPGYKMVEIIVQDHDNKFVVLWNGTPTTRTSFDEVWQVDDCN